MRITTIFLTSMLLVACQQGPSAEQLVKEQTLKIQHDAEIHAWRAERVEKLTAADGWLSLVGMHWLPASGVTRVGAAEDNGTRIRIGPDKLGVLHIDVDNSVWFQAESHVPVTLNGIIRTDRVKLQTDASGSPSVLGFNDGQASFIVIERGGKLALRVRDANAETRQKFTGIDYFDIDRNFRFEAQFTPHEAGRTIEIVNILGMVEPMMNPGTVTFTYAGEMLTLEAIDEGDHRLFLVFADHTSGHESYAAARFLYAAYPNAVGKTIVDFNKAYNPPCAFSAYSTCPMPPLSNRMDIAITAGEKKPRKITP
jgi:uncharacterized protein (DUF1684 family)